MGNNMRNRMVDAYGEEFNLSTAEIIECVERVYSLGVDDTNFRAKDIFGYDIMKNGDKWEIVKEKNPFLDGFSF